MFSKGMPPFRTMKSALMSFSVKKGKKKALVEKKVVCQLSQNIISPIKMSKSLASNPSRKKN